jgi:hypothetical protein
MQKKMEELHAKARATPNRFVMTTSTLVRVREAETVRSMDPNSGEAIVGNPVSFFGTPIEHYATLRECMDRMMSPQEGERLQLIVGDERIMDCFDHPFLHRPYGETARPLLAFV